MRPLGPLPAHLAHIDAEFAGEAAHRGAGVGGLAGKAVGRRRHGHARRRSNGFGGAGPEVDGGRHRRWCRCGDHGCGCRGGGRLGYRGRRSRRGTSADCHQRQQHALGHLVADLNLEFADHAGHRRGNVHGRLVRLQRHQRILGLDRVADLDQQFDDGHVLEVANVGHAHFDRRRRSGSGCRCCRRACCGRRSGGRCRRRSLRGPAFHQRDQAALGHRIADLELDLAHHAGHRRGHVHGRLVGLQGDQRVFRLDGVADLDQHFDDRHVLEVADVGHFHFDYLGHAASAGPPQGGSESVVWSGQSPRTFVIPALGAGNEGRVISTPSPGWACSDRGRTS